MSLIRVIGFVGLMAYMSVVRGDTLNLKDGQSLEGTFLSRSSTEVVFELAGQRVAFPVDKIVTITLDFSRTSAEPHSRSMSHSSPEEEEAAKVVPPVAIVEKGSPLRVKTQVLLDTNRHAKGHTFTALLEANLMAGSVVVAPKGSTVYGMVVDATRSRRLIGKSTMKIALSGIEIGGEIVPITTSVIDTATAGTGRKTARQVATGAAIGGLVGGSEDAKRGAKIGLGAAIISRGNQVQIPAGTLLDFILQADLKK